MSDEMLCYLSCCDWSPTCNPECPGCRIKREDHAAGEHLFPWDSCPVCRALHREELGLLESPR
jgi:hypothetical protein